VTLITPVLALGLGMWLNQEQPSASMLAGAVLILVALGAYLFGDRLTRLKAAGEPAPASMVAVRGRGKAR
jgi:drug/metabolite transporter (DMT)-like permease